MKKYAEEDNGEIKLQHTVLNTDYLPIQMTNPTRFDQISDEINQIKESRLKV